MPEPDLVCHVNHRCGTSHAKRLSCVALIAIALRSLLGCHDLPDEKETTVETQRMLRSLARVEAPAEPNITLPPPYKLSPQRTRHTVGGTTEWRLSYFCRNSTAHQMQQILQKQFTAELLAKDGRWKASPDYTITAHPAANQLIVRCPTEADIDAVVEILRHVDLPPIQVQIECSISEIHADITMDRETTILIENLFGEGATLGGKSDSRGNVLPAFPGASLRDLVREKFGLKLGVNSPLKGHTRRVLVDILVSKGYMKVLMNPTLKTMNGQPAEIHSNERVPLQQIWAQGGFGGNSFIESRTEYYEIIDSLKVTPHVHAGGQVQLNTEIRIGAHLTPQGVRQAPIVTERTIHLGDSRIGLGESLVIGGMRKREQFDVSRGTPILKDLPIVGHLFSGRDFEERAKEILFILTPTVAPHGTSSDVVIDTLDRRHSSPMAPDSPAAGGCRSDDR